MINSTTIDQDTIIKRETENLLTNELGDELVMMDMEGGNYISLNKIGRVIWDKIEQPTAVKDIIAYLCQRFDVDAATCSADTLEYLQNMLQQKVITIA